MVLLLLMPFVAQCTAEQDLLYAAFFNSTADITNTALCATKLSAPVCNVTVQCFWNQTICTGKTIFAAESRGVVEPYLLPWCAKFFPEVLLSLVYFAAAALTGFSAVGVVYLQMHNEVFTFVAETGEIMYNRCYREAQPYIAYCALLFISCALLWMSAFVNFVNESVCVYIYFVFVVLTLMLFPIVAYPVYRLQRYCAQRRQKVNIFDLDKFIMPETAQAIPPLNNQVRCF